MVETKEICLVEYDKSKGAYVAYGRNDDILAAGCMPSSFMPMGRPILISSERRRGMNKLVQAVQSSFEEEFEDKSIKQFAPL